MDRSRFPVLLVVMSAGGCAAPSPASPLPAPVDASPPLAPPAASLPAVASAASATPPATPPAASGEDGPGTPLPTALEDKDLPPAPCDLSRIYRGKIGTSTISLRLARKGEKVTGQAHYDLPGPAIELAGNYQGEKLTLDEKGAGHFEGACNGKTGWIEGSYELKKKKTDFRLVPRPLGEAGFHSVSERRTVQSPVPPACAGLKNTTETTFVKGQTCLPTDPKALAELQKESPVGRCTLEIQSPRVFGLADPGAERAANGVLATTSFGYASAEIRASIKKCPLNGETQSNGGYSVLYNDNEVLSLFFSGYVMQTGAAHGALFGPEGMVVDLHTGRRLVIGDLVTNESAFREAFLGCVGEDNGDPEDFTWGTKDAFRKQPRWVIVPGGIAIVLGDVSPVMYGGQGKGPIASFEALAGRQWLRSDSPVARLWAGVKPAAQGAPLCSTKLGSGEILPVSKKP